MPKLLHTTYAHAVGMVGLTLKRAGQQDLQRYTLPEDATLDDALQRLHSFCDFVESVYISTCNRVEVIFVAQPGVSIAECRRRLYMFFNQDQNMSGSIESQMRQASRVLHAYEQEGAVEHLFMVAASLDSVNIGDAQILGQIRKAYQLSDSLSLVGATLRFIFNEAFLAAKQVRHKTALGSGAISMLSLVVGLLEQRLRPEQSRLAIVGAGDMAQHCAAVLAKHCGGSLLFVNRTDAKAEALAKQYGGTAMSLAQFLQTPGHLDVLICATQAPEPLFDGAFFAKLTGSMPTCVDLSVMRNIDQQAAHAARADLYDLDEINRLAAVNKSARQAHMIQARTELESSLQVFRKRLVQRELAPLIKALRHMYEQTLNQEVTELLTSALCDCTPEQQASVRAWAQSLAGKLTHGPTMGLKNLAFMHDMNVVDAFMEGFLT